jgi:hypothetical protein
MRVESVGEPPEPATINPNFSSSETSNHFLTDHPRTRSSPRDASLSSFDQAQCEVGRAEFCGTLDFFRNRIALDHSRLTSGVVDGPIFRKIENESVVGLNLPVAADAREYHLGTAAESGEVMVAHGADGYQTLALDREWV